MALCFCLLDIKFSHQEPTALVLNQVRQVHQVEKN